MKLSKNTLSVLKNFANINAGFNMDEESAVKIMSPASTVIGVYDCAEKFPKFAVYNLVEFLGVIGLFDPDKIDMTFSDKSVEVSDGESKIRYMFTPADLIPHKCKESTKYKSFKDYKSSFEMPKDILAKIIKAAGIMKLGQLHIELKDGKGKLILKDSDKTTANVFEMPLTGTGDANIDLLVENLQIIQDDYTVRIAENFVKFEHKSQPLFYIISKKVETAPATTTDGNQADD